MQLILSDLYGNQATFDFQIIVLVALGPPNYPVGIVNCYFEAVVP